MKLPEIALIVRAPYARQLVEGFKLLEMRSRATTIRGRVGIIEAGTGMIIGEVSIYDCFKLDESEFKKFQPLHKV